VRVDPRRLVTGALLLLALLVLSAAASWPLAGAPGAWFPSDPSMPDLNVAVWLPAHLAAAASGATDVWDAAELQHPHGQRIDLLVWNVGVQVLQLPFFTLLEPIPAFNLSIVAFGALNGLSGYTLGRQLGGRAAGAAGAAVLLFSPFAWNELAQGRGEQGLLAGVAFTAAALVALGRDPTPRRAALAGLAWALTGLCYWFYAYFLLLLVLPLGALALARRRGREARALVVTGAVAAAVAGPFALALLVEAVGQASVYRQAVADDVRPITAMVQQGASLGLDGLVWPRRAPTLLRDVVPLSALVAVVGALATRARGQAGFLLPVALGGVLLAMGRVLQWAPGEPVLVGGMQLSLPFAALQGVLPGFARLWWPYRWLSFFFVGGAGCAAALVAWLPPRVRALAAAGLALGLLGELRLAQGATTGGLVWDSPVPVDVPAALREIDAPVVMLPFHGVAANRLLWQAYVQQPTSAGLGDTEPYLQTPTYRDVVQQTPILRQLEVLGQQPPVGGRVRISGLEDGRAELRALGFGAAVLWVDLHPLAPYAEWLGPPDHLDATMAIWTLGP
jgi:hypothetical protein